MQEPNEKQRFGTADNAPAPANERRWRNELARNATQADDDRGFHYPGPGAADANESGAPAKPSGVGPRAADRGAETAGAPLATTRAGITATPDLRAKRVTEGIGKDDAEARSVGKFQKAREQSRQIRSMTRGGAQRGDALPGGVAGMPAGMNAMRNEASGATAGVAAMQRDRVSGEGGAFAQARTAFKSASPLGKLQMAKEGMQIGEQILKNPDIRWKAISKIALGSGGTVLLVLVILAPLVSLAFLIASYAMNFRISGKEMLLMAALNVVFAACAIGIAAQIALMACIFDPTCLGSTFISSVF